MITPLELAANAIVAASIFLAGRNSIHTWWSGIIGCALFAGLFLRTNLYADVVLQGFFVATSVVGWWQWQRGGHGGALPIRRVAASTLSWIVLGSSLVVLGYGALLHRFTDAYAPFWDSAVLVFSVAAQLLMMRRRLQSWPLWLLVNTIAVPLYASRGLYLTAALYAAYWVNALVAWRHWRTLAERQSGPVADAEPA